MIDYLSMPIRKQLHQPAASPRAIFNPNSVFASGVSRSSQAATEFSKHYTLWNYVTIKRRSSVFAALFPLFGRIKAGAVPTVRRQGLIARKQLDYLQRRGIVRQGVDDVEPIGLEHPAVELLKRVNTGDSYYTLAFETMLQWRLTGRFYWWLIPGTAGFPAEIHVVPTGWVTREWSKSGELLRYKVHSPDSGTIRFIPAQDMISHRDPSPTSKIGEHSSIKAGAKWIQSAEEIEDSRIAAFQNGPNFDVALLMDQEKYNAAANPDAITEIQERFMTRHAGVANAKKPAVIPPGITIEKLSNTPQEMDYPTSAEQIRDNNFALQETPSIVAGVTKDFNRATADAAKGVYCEFTIDADTTAFDSFLVEMYLPFFPDTENMTAFHMPCAPDDPELALRRDRQDFDMGALSPDETAIMRGREAMAVPASESRYIGGNMMPLDDDLLPDEPTPEEIAAEMEAANDSDSSDDELDQTIRTQLLRAFGTAHSNGDGPGNGVEHL